MKWINIPEGAESGGLHVCECVCRQTALGDQSAQLLAASNGVSLSLSLCLSHTHSCFLAACTHRLGVDCFDRGQHFGVTKQYNHTVYQPRDCFFSPSLVTVANFMKPYFFGDAAGRQTGRSRALACSHLSADLQAACDRSLGAYSGCVVPSWAEAAM